MRHQYELEPFCPTVSTVLIAPSVSAPGSSQGQNVITRSWKKRLVHSCSAFKDYLYGHQFVLVTDHKTFTAFFTPRKAIPPLAAARIQCWALFLGNYSYTLQYRKGSENSNTDALSRLQSREMTITTSRSTLCCPMPGIGTAICAREMKQMTDRDTTRQQVKQ